MSFSGKRLVIGHLCYLHLHHLSTLVLYLHTLVLLRFLSLSVSCALVTWGSSRRSRRGTLSILRYLSLHKSSSELRIILDQSQGLWTMARICSYIHSKEGRLHGSFAHFPWHARVRWTWILICPVNGGRVPVVPNGTGVISILLDLPHAIYI
jgi:hypothetical protein